MGWYLFYDAPIARVRAGREGQCSYKDNRVRLNSKLCITMQLANYCSICKNLCTVGFIREKLANFGQLNSRVVDPVKFFADPDSTFYFNVDPDPKFSLLQNLNFLTV